MSSPDTPTRYSASDGNKRLGWAATAVFLGINGHRVLVSNDEVVELVLAVAAGELTEVAAIAERLGRPTPPATP